MSRQVMMFNPFTGQPRDPRDIQSDPYGQLIWDGETPLEAAAPAPSLDHDKEELRRFWNSLNDAAPALEPVAWALQHKNGLAFEFAGFIQPTREGAEEMQRRHFGNPTIVPLYLHPAAPAPDDARLLMTFAGYLSGALPEYTSKHPEEIGKHVDPFLAAMKEKP